MLSWFRGRARSISSAALISLITLTVWSAAPHPDDCHDAECGPVAPHDPSGHRVGREQKPGGQPLHCVLCHWTRIVRPTPETALHLSPAVGEVVRIHLVVFRAPSQFSSAQPPLRAPPALPVVA